jgi:hypothetical protein
MTAFLELRVPTSRVVAGPGSAPLQPLSDGRGAVTDLAYARCEEASFTSSGRRRPRWPLRHKTILASRPVVVPAASFVGVWTCRDG